MPRGPPSGSREYPLRSTYRLARRPCQRGRLRPRPPMPFRPVPLASLRRIAGALAASLWALTPTQGMTQSAPAPPPAGSAEARPAVDSVALLFAAQVAEKRAVDAVF